MKDFLRQTTPHALVLFLAACGGSAETAPRESTGEPTQAAPTDPSSTTADEDLPLASFCSAGQVPSYEAIGKTIFDALAPDAPASYLALRRNKGGIPSPGLTEELELVAERGRRCDGAPDAASCAKAYDALRPRIRLGFQHCFTRGGTAACVQSATDAMTLLGHVTSIEEAFFVAEYAGYGVTCSSSDVAARGKALADGSFELVLAKTKAGGPCGQVHRAVVVVGRDGSVVERKSELVDDSPSCP